MSFVHTGARHTSSTTKELAHSPLLAPNPVSGLGRGTRIEGGEQSLSHRGSSASSAGFSLRSFASATWRACLFAFRASNVDTCSQPSRKTNSVRLVRALHLLGYCDWIPVSLDTGGNRRKAGLLTSADEVAHGTIYRLNKLISGTCARRVMFVRVFFVFAQEDVQFHLLS